MFTKISKRIHFNNSIFRFFATNQPAKTNQSKENGAVQKAQNTPNQPKM